MVRQSGWISLVSALAALGFATACQSGGTDNTEEEASGETASGESGSDEVAEADAEPVELTVYCGRGEQLVAPAIDAFREATGVDVRVNYGSTSELAATIIEEGARSPADVFIAQDVSHLGLLEERDVFQPLNADVLNRVPEQFRSPDGEWVGITGRARVLSYNTAAVTPEQLPASVEELTTEAWRGRVGWAPENGSFQSFVAAMVQLRGEEATQTWVTAMQNNEPHAYSSNTPMLQALGRGEIDVGITNHYYLYRMRDENGADFPVENHYFRAADAASLVNISGVGILAGTDEAETANAFVAFLLSDEGQNLFVDGNHEFPLVPGVASPAGLPSIDTLNAPSVSLSNLSDLEATVRILQTAGALQ